MAVYAPTGAGLSQGDPVAMQQAYETYSTSIDAMNEAWNRINVGKETLNTSYTGGSGGTFGTTVQLWLDKFTVVIQNLSAMRDALGAGRAAYINNEANNTDSAQSLMNITNGADIQHLL